MSYPAYAETKASGVEWLGDVPKDWDVTRLKFVCSRSALYGANESADGYQDDGVRFLRTTDIDDAGNLSDAVPVFLDEDKVQDYLLENGDILLSRSGTIGRAFLYDEAKHGRCAYAGYLVRFCLNNACLPKFFFYFTKSQSFTEWLSSAVIQSTIGNVNGQKYANVSFSLPPLPEQQQIAAFLDRKTAELDAVLRLKERQLELLAEKRQALISQAVTRGLDPTAPLKPSGIPWLGDVPGHWDVKRLKYVAALQTGLTLGKDYKGRETVTRPYLRVANVQDGFLDLAHITEVMLPVEEASGYELRPGDVLMTEGGDFDKLGRGHVWSGEIPGCLHQNHIFAVRPNSRRLNPLFLASLMTSGYGKAYFTSTSQQTTNLATTNSTKLKDFPIPAPPLAEQAAIVAYLDRETARMDGTAQAIRAQIGTVREYRQALISAAVTGKIDVRGA